MKTKEDIEARLRTLLKQEVDDRFEKATQRLPKNCSHHIEQLLDYRKTVEGEPNSNYNRITVTGKALPVVQTIGLCGLNRENPEEWNGTICEDPSDAKKCPYFDSLRTKEAVFSEFEWQTKDVEWLAENHPEISSLLWVLEDRVRMSWFDRLKLRLRRFRVEAKQLPAPKDGWELPPVG